MLIATTCARVAAAGAVKRVVPRTIAMLVTSRPIVLRHPLRIGQLRRVSQAAASEHDDTQPLGKQRSPSEAEQSNQMVVMMLKTGMMLCAAVFIASRFIAIVPANSTGLVDYFGQVAEQPLMPGLHFINPLQNVHIFSLRTQKQQTTLSCPSKEGLPVKVEGAVLYHVEPKAVRDLFLNVGAEWAEVIMEPRVNSAVRTVCSEHEAKDLYGAQRSSMQDKLEKTLQDSLSKHGVTIESCLLKNVTLPKSVADEIEEKLRAEERSHRMQHVLQAERQEAERKAIEAQGIADFQRIVAEGVSKELLQWKGIEATSELAKSTNAKVVIIGNPRDGLPLVLGGVAQA